ncbi:hypothetical protein N7494_007303 [Penicillium frequentans]|uniref:Uncharacterized protein n=1 Tax=Penicillium frequentans TaxID=3151616 RepID=A0AAD6GE23_9EURO|nr:hypothetical protein N7494_007303 [Penicillium glabrum]
MGIGMIKPPHFILRGSVSNESIGKRRKDLTGRNSMKGSSSIWPSVRRWRRSQQEQGKRKPNGDTIGD